LDFFSPFSALVFLSFSSPASDSVSSSVVVSGSASSGVLSVSEVALNSPVLSEPVNVANATTPVMSITAPTISRMTGGLITSFPLTTRIFSNQPYPFGIALPKRDPRLFSSDPGRASF
jgi:hypothetical protein